MPVNSKLLEELLAKPVGPSLPRRKPSSSDFTKEIEVNGPSLVATIVNKPGVTTEGTALAYIEEEGLNPDDWEIATWKKSKWGSAESPLESVRFTFKRRDSSSDRGEFFKEQLDDAIASLKDYVPVAERPQGEHGYLVLLGDMQFGKIDGDGPAGTLERTIQSLNKAADALVAYRQIIDIGHIHIAWLGDHIEGFVSQGGANTWRTTLTLNEQIRLTQAVMLHALKLFAPMAEKVSMAAVPGNHGEPIRFMGTGTTRYDDSHDTESLIGISKMIESLGIEGFDHVEFFVPDTDELIVVTNVAGTVIAHAHGHKHRPGKHFEWWRGQAFDRESAMHLADLLVEGHLHHEFIEADGSRLFMQVPAMESESTWFKHSTGTGGSPGLMVAITKDGRTPIKHMVVWEGEGK